MLTQFTSIRFNDLIWNENRKVLLNNCWCGSCHMLYCYVTHSTPSNRQFRWLLLFHKSREIVRKWPDHHYCTIFSALCAYSLFRFLFRQKCPSVICKNFSENMELARKSDQKFCKNVIPAWKIWIQEMWKFCFSRSFFEIRVCQHWTIKIISFWRKTQKLTDIFALKKKSIKVFDWQFLPALSIMYERLRSARSMQARLVCVEEK